MLVINTSNGTFECKFCGKSCLLRSPSDAPNPTFENNRASQRSGSVVQQDARTMSSEVMREAAVPVVAVPQLASATLLTSAGKEAKDVELADVQLPAAGKKRNEKRGKNEVWSQEIYVYRRAAEQFQGLQVLINDAAAFLL